MPHNTLILLLVQLFVLLVAALVAGKVARQIGFPAVVGELLAGVCLGPTLFGMLAPSTFASLFPNDTLLTAGREAILRLGMLLFLFTAGREVRLSQLRTQAKSVISVSLVGIAVPFLLGAGSAHWFSSLFPVPTNVSRTTITLFVGTALSISALPVIARILADLGLLRKPFGTLVLSSAALDDVVGWSLFSALLHPSASPSLGLFLAPVIMLVLAIGIRPLVARYALPRLNRIREGSRCGAFLAVTLLFAAGAESLGLHAVFGAFAAGVLFAPDTNDSETDKPDAIGTLGLSFFAPIYFVSVGLKLNFVTNFDPVLVSVVLLVACVGKILGAGLGARLSGQTWREAWAVGCAMNARGAMEILLASVALDAGLIEGRLFVALIVTAVVTSVMAGPLVKMFLRE